MIGTTFVTFIARINYEAIIIKGSSINLSGGF